MKNSEKPAFPIRNNDGFATSFEYVNSKNENCWAIGLTKREYFAAIALSGMAHGYSDARQAAQRAIEFSDELLKQLEL